MEVQLLQQVQVQLQLQLQVQAQQLLAPTAAPAQPVNIKMITWVQESNQKAIDALNAAFTAKFPNVTFTVDTVGANDYPTLQNARIAAGDVDIITQMAPFDLYPRISQRVVTNLLGQPLLKAEHILILQMNLL